MACESLLQPPGYQWYYHTTYGQALMIILIQKTPTVWSFQPAWLANLVWGGQHHWEVFLILSLFFSPWKTKRSRGQCCVWGERGPRRERWWLRPCPCRPEGEGHLEERQRERKENDRNMAGDRAGEGESAICLAWQQLGGLPLQVVYQEGKHHHSFTSRSTFTVNSFGGIKFTSKSFESHGFHAGL